MPPVPSPPGQQGTFPLTSAHTNGQVTVASGVVGPNAGPPAHSHANEDEIFVLQSGSLELLVNGEIVVARAGDVAYMARDEVHRFRGLDGGEPNDVHTLIIPGGFEQFMAQWVPLVQSGTPDTQKVAALSAEYGITLFPGDDMPPVPAQPQSKIVRQGEGQHYQLMGTNVSILLNSAATQGRCSLIRIQGSCVAGPPPHIHEREDELFIIEAGRVELLLGTETVVAEAGDMAWAPRGHAHTFRLLSEKSRMVVLTTPGGFEEFFPQAVALEQTGGATLEAIIALHDKMGVKFLPPSN